ncbi:MAG TPA: HAD-IA family hydrolase [Acidobacteriota bacterium]|nr:HAD-IA family hydrolase [Acidobacteriota bacterium]
MTSKRYRCIYFDAGNTLLRVYPSIGFIYADTARRYGARLDEEAVEASFRALWNNTAPLVSNEGHRLSYEREKDWWRDIVMHVFRDHVRFEDFNTFFDELYARFARAESWKLYEDVLEILEKLRHENFRMAMISNWDSRLPALIEQLGIQKYFEKVVVSALVGYEKPHPAIFQIALEDTGLAPEEVVYVGDDLFLDYQAARKAGWNAIHLDRHDRFEHHEDRICSLHDLPLRLACL